MDEHRRRLDRLPRRPESGAAIATPRPTHEAGMKTGLAKQFKQVLDAQAKRARRLNPRR
jgi:hypothetical protein